jgi:sarcosine oxidase gamma subunit
MTDVVSLTDAASKADLAAVLTRLDSIEGKLSAGAATVVNDAKPIAAKVETAAESALAKIEAELKLLAAKAEADAQSIGAKIKALAPHIVTWVGTYGAIAFYLLRHA